MNSETLKKISLSKDNNLTLPQKKFVVGVVNGLNPTQSARQAYPTQTDASARVTATENMKKKKVRNAIERALIKSNLSEQRITDIISDAMETETPHTIDWSVKHSYITTALRLKGYLNNNNQPNTQVNVQLNLE
jgi:hypothetical protein